MSPELLKALEAPTFDQAVTNPVPESSGYGGIVARNLGNLLPKAINSVGDSLAGIGNFFRPDDQPQLDIPNVPNFVSEPKAVSKGEQIANVITGGVLPELAAMFVPFLAVSKVAKLGGLGRVGSTIAANIGQGAFGGIKYGPEQALEGAALGGAASAIGAIPKFSQRILPALALGGEEYARNLSEGPGQAATAAAIGFGGSLLPSVSRNVNAASLPKPEFSLGVGAIPEAQVLGPLAHEAVDTSSLRLGSSQQPQFPTVDDFIKANAFPTEQLGPTNSLRLEPGTPARNKLVNDADMPLIGLPRVSMEDFASSVQVRRPMPITYIEGVMPEVPLRQSINDAIVNNPKPEPIREISQLVAPVIEPSGQPSMGNMGIREPLFNSPMSGSAEGGFALPEIRNTLATSIAGGLAGGIVDANQDSGISFAALGAGLPLIPSVTRGLSKLLKSNETGALTVPHASNSQYPKYRDTVHNVDMVRIPNSEMKIDWDGLGLKTGVSVEKRLGEFVDHPIFAQYPDLQNLKVRIRINPVQKPGMKNAYWDKANSPWDEEFILINAKSQEQAHKILGHELQHAIDNRNGLPYNPDNLPYRKAPGEMRAFADETMEDPIHTFPQPDWLKKQEGGFALPEITTTLGGGIAGALTGAAVSEGDPYATAAGGLLGAGLGAGIAAGATSPNLRQAAKQIKNEATSASKLVKTIAPSTDLKKTFEAGIKDITQGNTYGQGGGLSKITDFFDKQLRITMSPEEKAAITAGRGKVALHAERGVAHIKNFFNGTEITPMFKEQANKYLDGISQSTTDEVNFLRTAGGVDAQTFSALPPAQKAGLTKWRVQEDVANPKGVGPHKAFDFYVPVNNLDNLKSQWLSKLTNDFLSSVQPSEKPMAESLVQARGHFNEVQKIFAAALPAGDTQEQVAESVGRYVPRLFEFFTNPKYKVTDEMVDKYITEFSLNRRGDVFKDAIQTGEAYDANVFSNLLSKAQPGTPQAARLAAYQNYNLNGRSIMAQPQIVGRMAALENESHLRNMVRAHLQELRAGSQIGGGKVGAAGGGLDRTLFERREDLTPGFKELLGEHTDPFERMGLAFSRTYAPAQAAAVMDAAKGIKTASGLPSALTAEQWSSELMKASQSNDIAKQQALQQMKLLGSSAQFGEYANNYVTRHLADYFEGGSQVWNSSIGHNIAEFNRLFKTGHVPLNPLSHVRQIVSMPAFLAIGRAAPQDMSLAWNAMKTGAKEEGTAASVVRDELLSVGAWTSDLIKGELQGNLDSIINGKYDSEISKLAKGGINKVLEAYRKPDMLVRAATYLGAKRRALGEGLAEPAARQQALEWMDRYTMNYDNIAPAVRFLRNVPGVSPFISYQAEMLRITKNMLTDGLSGNIERLGTLAGITALPLGAAYVAEQSLNSEDKKKWAQTKALMPDYNQGKILLPTGKNANGSMKFWDISPVVNHADLMRMVSNLAQGKPEVALSQNPFVGTTSSPILQALAKITTQRDVRTGQEYGGPRETALAAVSDILPPITPGVGYEWKRLANVNVENLYTGRKESWADWFTRAAVGVSSSSIRNERLLASVRKDFEREARNEQFKYTKIAQTQGEGLGLEARKKVAYGTMRENIADLMVEAKAKLERAGQL